MRKKDVVKSINMTNDLCKAECSKSNNCQGCHFNKKNKVVFAIILIQNYY